MQLRDSITALKGVGEQVGRKLNKLGIFTLQDMIEHYPREYEDRRKITPLVEMELDTPINILVVVASTPQVTRKGNHILVTFRVKDATGSIFVTFYGQAYMKNKFSVGERFFNVWKN